jgi:hypothetical protein
VFSRGAADVVGWGGERGLAEAITLLIAGSRSKTPRGARGVPTSVTRSAAAPVPPTAHVSGGRTTPSARLRTAENPHSLQSLRARL